MGLSKCRENYYEYRVKLSPKNRKILEDLKTQKLVIGDLQSELQEIKSNQILITPLKNEEIITAFKQALKIADTEFDMTAAWAKEYIVAGFVDDFESLLQRGVTIKILYGISGVNDKKAIERNEQTNQVILNLKERFKDYPNFKIKYNNSHNKLFICDDKFFVQTSLNILSNNLRHSGGSSNEVGIKISNNLDTLLALRKYYFDF